MYISWDFLALESTWNTCLPWIWSLLLILSTKDIWRAIARRNEESMLEVLNREFLMKQLQYCISKNIFLCSEHLKKEKLVWKVSEAKEANFHSICSSPTCSPSDSLCFVPYVFSFSSYLKGLVLKKRKEKRIMCAYICLSNIS